MPHQTNDFQTLITILEAQLAPAGAVVTESKMLTDVRTGEQREVDVVIETRVGGHPMVIAVESIDHSRKADVEWVDKILGKYRDMPVDKIVVVSRAGFTRAAQQKAEASRFHTLTLGQAQTLDWTKFLDDLLEVEVHAVLFPTEGSGRVTLVAAGAAADLAKSELDPWQSTIRAPDGASLGAVFEFAYRLTQDPRVHSDLGFDGLPVGDHPVAFEYPLEPGSYVETVSGKRLGIRALQVRGIARRRNASMPVRRASYGDAQVGHATAEAFEGRVTFATVAREGEQPTAMVVIRPSGGVGAATRTEIEPPRAVM